ncbi:unnamed protein product [Urochloa humidicola]
MPGVPWIQECRAARVAAAERLSPALAPAASGGTVSLEPTIAPVRIPARPRQGPHQPPPRSPIPHPAFGSGGGRFGGGATRFGGGGAWRSMSIPHHCPLPNTATVLLVGDWLVVFLFVTPLALADSAGLTGPLAILTPPPSAWSAWSLPSKAPDPVCSPIRRFRISRSGACALPCMCNWGIIRELPNALETELVT